MLQLLVQLRASSSYPAAAVPAAAEPCGPLGVEGCHCTWKAMQFCHGNEVESHPSDDV